jgi:superfamily II DNA or RNA helicase
MSPAQASLFDRPAPAPPRPTIELRPYQVEACDAADEVHQRCRSALIVHPTGTGKTTEFCEMIARRPAPALVIAHRTELIEQAARRIRTQTGRSVSIEKAERYGELDSDVVVASVQTLGEGRLRRWSPDHFKLLVVDEAHHAIAPSYQLILSHFTGAKILGVTATPDRADEQAMGQVFDEVAHIYEIGDAITDGWLCRIRAMYIRCDAVDLASVHTVAGDLNQGELEMVMSSEAALHQVVRPTLEEAGDRPTVAFTTSVANAHRMAEVFNRYRVGCARAIDGGTDDTTRRRTLADFDAGRFQFIVNVGVLTEGWDCPRVACIAMGRPTKSRALYAQMAGRGTRPFAGKDDLLLLDFVGNAGKHRLVSAADILAGKYPEDIVAMAAKAIEEDPGADVYKALANAEAQAQRAAAEEAARVAAAARRAAAKTQVTYQKQEIDPFGFLGIEAPKYAGRFGDEPATEKQIEVLRKKKVPLPEKLTKRAASRLLTEIGHRMDKGLCTFAQAAQLAKYGYDKNLPFDQAHAVMDAIVSGGWKRLSPDHYARLTARVPGQEG